MTKVSGRQRAWRRGRTAETLSVAWIRLLGYRIVATRLRTPVGEIDITARRGRVLAVVEVKARDTKAAALHAVTPRQRLRLQRAAQWLVARRPDLAGLQIRFDVFAFVPWRWPTCVIDAWRPEAD